LSTYFSAQHLASVPVGKYDALCSTHILSNQDRSGHHVGYATANYNITLISLLSEHRWHHRIVLHELYKCWYYLIVQKHSQIKISYGHDW
jgi:hypothetical protein